MIEDRVLLLKILLTDFNLLHHEFCLILVKPLIDIILKIDP